MDKLDRWLMNETARFERMIGSCKGRGSLSVEIGPMRKTCCVMPVLLACRSQHNSDENASFSDFLQCWLSDSDRLDLAMLLSWLRLTENSVVWFKDTCLSVELAYLIGALLFLFRMMYRSATPCFSFHSFLDEIVRSFEENEYIGSVARLLL